jgi:hypothetical protein
MQAKLDQGILVATSRWITHRATRMLFRQGALRASCGGALQIFPEAMTDNILVIDGRKRVCTSQFAGLSAARTVFTSNVWRRAPQVRQQLRCCENA